MMHRFRNKKIRLIATMLFFCLPIVIAANPGVPNTGGVILQYHHIADITPQSTSTTIKLFQQHLKFLHEQGFNVWSLEKLVSKSHSNNKIPDKVVSITFDDAYQDVYQNAWPLLKKYKYPATIFVTTALIGHKGYLTWQQLNEMKKGGLTIANHSHQHPHLIRRLKHESHRSWAQRVSKEIIEAQVLIHKRINTKLKYFAYPYGEYDDELREIINNLGFIGFGQQSGAINHRSKFTALPRFPLSGLYGELDSFKLKVYTKAMPLIKTVFSGEKGAQSPTLDLFFDTANYRFEELACFGPHGKMPIKQLSDKHFQTSDQNVLPVGRSRYNCTMPINSTAKVPLERFYWHSQMWIRKQQDGRWYSES